MLKIPKLFVLQLMLTYRYISVLLEEAEKDAKGIYAAFPAAK